MRTENSKICGGHVLFKEEFVLFLPKKRNLDIFPFEGILQNSCTEAISRVRYCFIYFGLVNEAHMNKTNYSNLQDLCPRFLFMTRMTN